MKNYILIVNDITNQFNNIEELIDYIFGMEYKTLSNKEKLYKRYEKAFYLKKLLNDETIDIVETDIGVLLDNYTYIKRESNLENAIIVDNEITLIKSLCKYKQMLLLERKGLYILHDKRDEEELSQEDNYIIINNMKSIKK